MLLNLLPQLTLEIIGWVGSSAGVLFAIFAFLYNRYVKKQEEERAETEKLRKGAFDRIKALEDEVKHFMDASKIDEKIGVVQHTANENTIKMSSIVQQFERHNDAVDSRFRSVESKTNIVDGMSSDMMEIKIKQGVASSKQDDMQRSIDDLKAANDRQFSEILGILKQGVYNK